MSGLSGLFDDGSGEARQFNREQLRFIRQLFGRPWQPAIGEGGRASIFGHLLEGYRRGLPEMQKAADVAGKGYQSAISSIGGAGIQARRDIADQTRQAVSATQQGAASRGLYSSSSAMQAGHQARYQGQRASGNLGAQLGGLFSQTHLAGSANYARVLEDLARFYTQKGRDIAGVGSNFAGIMSQYQAQPGVSPFQQFAGLLGQGLGAGIGVAAR